MIFTEGQFFIFFATAFAVHWSIRSNEWRKAWLLACSMFFYAAWDWRFLGLVFFVILNTYVTTLAIAATKEDARRDAILATGITISLGVLAFFKYYNFFIVSIADILPMPARIASIILPIGISFYTFHSLSYMIDTHRGKIVPTRNFVDVALYILFFPQLVAGPIVRATDLLPQFRSARSFAHVDFKLFLAMFLVGYFKKAVVSDNLSPLVDAFYAHPQAYGATDAFIAVVFYSIQIYCDFSGYTDMAIAVAGLLGYQLRPNFAHPYLAPNLIDFWRRWHISLSSWLRDYLYIPLGGNRDGPLMQARNVMITMLLGGLWHGASWTFVIWGGLHGVGLIGCRIWQAVTGSTGKYSIGGNLLTFAWVTFAWIFFRVQSLSDIPVVFGRFAELGMSVLPWSVAAALVAVLALLHVLFYRAPLERLVWRTNDILFGCGFGAALALILPLVNAQVRPFIYFQF